MSKEERLEELEDGVYSVGDEIVHAVYGVGKITKVEEKELEGETNRYYVVETENSTFWMPIEEADADRTRLVVSSKVIEDEVIDVMKAEPQEMADHYKTRRKTISDAKNDGNIITTAEVVRDLAYRRAVDRLNTTERRGLNTLKKRLIKEWSASMGEEPRKVRARINQILRENIEEKAKTEEID